jgi:hypothetical protein
MKNFIIKSWEIPIIYKNPLSIYLKTQHSHSNKSLKKYSTDKLLQIVKKTVWNQLGNISQNLCCTTDTQLEQFILTALKKIEIINTITLGNIIRRQYICDMLLSWFKYEKTRKEKFTVNYTPRQIELNDHVSLQIDRIDTDTIEDKEMCIMFCKNLIPYRYIREIQRINLSLAVWNMNQCFLFKLQDYNGKISILDLIENIDSKNLTEFLF